MKSQLTLTFENGHSVSGSWVFRKYSSSSGSSRLRMPWSIRSTCVMQ
jgi:hypothetical protein